MSPLYSGRRIEDLDAARTLFAPIAAAAQEVAAFAYLDPNWMILGIRHSIGAIDWIAPSVRMIASDVIAFQATGVMMAHNHPSGDPTPSAADRNFTRILARTLEALGARLIDHLVVARGRVVSLRADGLL